MPSEPASSPDDALAAVRDAYERTLAARTARYTCRMPAEGPAETTAHGCTDLTTGAATMTSVFPTPPAPPVGDGLLVLDGLISLPGRTTPDEQTAHALLVPQGESLTMVLLPGPPVPDEAGCWTAPPGATRLPLERDPVLGSLAATFCWLAAVAAAEPAATPGRFRVRLELARLVDAATPERRDAVRSTLDEVRAGLSSGSVEGVVQVDPGSGLVTSVVTEGDSVRLDLHDHGVDVRVAVLPEPGPA
ncbi:hypothetical protein ACFFKU_00780 [Kineococcus gynurae]|uniref:Uncharacterized protein n=1 Tax=Kineococcus gynurae TaxID=452979 RepID=A0ABV5LPX2_9ACTN